MRDVAQLKGFWDAMQALVAQRKLLAYHDRSDGGLLVTLAEMAFAGHCGVTADIAALGDDRLAALFNEELGAVIQVRAADREAVEALLAMNGLADCVHYLGRDGRRSFCYHRRRSAAVQRKPHHAAYVVGGDHRQMQRLRDNPECADQEHRRSLTIATRALTLSCRLISMKMLLRRILRPARARKWLCCASRVNSHVEMAAAFHRAGFDAIDVHMSDLLAGRTGLGDFHALVACGGFSYGDVLGQAKVGRNRFCSTNAYAMSSPLSSIARRRWRWACVTVVR